MKPKGLIVTVPEDLRAHAEEVGCAAVGFSTHADEQPPPTTGPGADWSMHFSQAMAWLGTFKDVLRQAHVVLTDGTVLYFGRQGFVTASAV
ncbi:MAG: hypothetical protein KC502_15770 [Myxococcales bacterium]|nr:hypothetical protein [Myxococcales bacterium]